MSKSRNKRLALIKELANNVAYTSSGKVRSGKGSARVIRIPVMMAAPSRGGRNKTRIVAYPTGGGVSITGKSDNTMSAYQKLFNIPIGGSTSTSTHTAKRGRPAGSGYKSAMKQLSNEYKSGGMSLSEYRKRQGKILGSTNHKRGRTAGHTTSHKISGTTHNVSIATIKKQYHSGDITLPQFRKQLGHIIGSARHKRGGDSGSAVSHSSSGSYRGMASLRKAYKSGEISLAQFRKNLGHIIGTARHARGGR